MLLVLHNNLAVGGGPTNYSLTTTPGSYSLTGFSSNLVSDKILQSTPGAYSVTGTTGNLLYSPILSTTAGSYVVNFSDASLTVSTPNKVLESVPETYNIVFSDASLRYSGEAQILKPGGKGLSPWQLRQNRLEALKKELWYLYQDENDEELKEAILEVVRDETNLDDLLILLRQQLTLVKNLYDKAQQEQYQKAFEAAEEIKQVKARQKKQRNEEAAVMLLF